MSYLGIDLGTTNSVGVIFNDQTDTLEAVKIDGIDEILPSVVAFMEDEVIVGQEAKAGAIIYPEKTISSIKRKMGDTEPIILGDLSKTIEEISSEIIKKMKMAAEKQAGRVFDEVVITHPAYFNDRQIFATKEAGSLAGFTNVHLLSEPLAAAIEYGYKQGYAQTLLVYDLGGGTFDACVLQVSQDENGEEIFQELSDVGDMTLGGDDFDAELIRFMMEAFTKETGIDINSLDRGERQRVIQKLQQEAEQTKKHLSGAQSTTIGIHPLLIHEGVPKNLSLEISREDFEALIRKYIDQSKDIVEEALKRAGKSADDISKVILVGGSTLIPMVKRTVAGFLKEPYRATDPAKSVAMGAAIYNYLIHLPTSHVKVSQITRHIFGTEAIVDTNTMKMELFPIIPMGSPIPTQMTDRNFSTLAGSAGANIHVYQWEEGFESDKKYIGHVTMSGVLGDSQIELTYAIDDNNLFEVFVKDVATGKEERAIFDRSKAMIPPPVTARSVVNKVNIVFIIDTTGSMDTYINGVKDRAIEFSDILHSRGTDFKLGLIGFGDLYEKENPSVYNFTTDVERFQKQVMNIPRTFGGDIPESSLDALLTGLDLLDSLDSSDGAKNIFILITDAPPHVPTYNGKTIGDMVELLSTQQVITYVVAKKDHESIEAFDPITKPDGKYYDLRDKFFDILDNIAQEIASLVRL